MVGNYQGIVDESGFTEMPAQRYWNRYDGNTGFKGDATNADGPAGFYGDYTAFVYPPYFWSIHGAPWYEGVVTGVFNFNSLGGGMFYNVGSRMTLVAW